MEHVLKLGFDYGLAASDDPRSVLYRDILGPQDLDYASEDF